MKRKPLHIAILSYDRPAYLKKVLRSLARQLMPQDRVAIFQDGGWNPYDGQFRASAEGLAACMGLCREIMPQAELFTSSVNLSIAGNYRRAEQYMFQALGADAALFLEDDLVLSKDYLTVIDRLLDLARENPLIGYVSAYGDLWASREAQEKRAGQLMPMHENWGAAMTRASWIKQRPVRELYWSMVRDIDYRARDNGRIAALYREMGYEMDISSQDGSRWIACVENGLVRLTTATCHARYIGAVGEHFRADRFRRYRFDAAQFYRTAPDLIAPTPRQIAKWQREAKTAIRAGYRHSYVIAEEQKQLRELDADGLLQWAKEAVTAGDVGRGVAAFEARIARFPDLRDDFGDPLFRKEYFRHLSFAQKWEEMAALIEQWPEGPGER
jgi:hypothetical protein